MNYEKAESRFVELAAEYGKDISDNGGGLREGCRKDSYFVVGGANYYAALALRVPKEGREPYFSITRLSNGRKIVEDQVPVTEASVAEEAFRLAVAIAQLEEKCRTVGLIDRRDELWLHTQPSRR